MNTRIGILGITLTLLTLWPVASEPEVRETARDQKVHLAEEIILDIPDLPPLCNAMDIEKGRIDVGGCELYCEREGEGMPVVLINGGPGGTHHGFHPHFSKATEFATVVYYDQRGCGISDYTPGGGFSIDQAVDDLDKLRQALGYDQWVVLGHSYGGLLAQCYGVKHPERLTGLVLVGSKLAMMEPLKLPRQYDFLSQEERQAISRIYKNKKLSSVQSVFNSHLNGDWKRQNYYRPTVEELARMARHGWKHSILFRGSIG